MENTLTKSSIKAGRVKKALYKKSGGLCALCRLYVPEAYYSKDHIIPKSRGGSSTISNYQLAHTTCNGLKGDKDSTYAYQNAYGEVLLAKIKGSCSDTVTKETVYKKVRKSEESEYNRLTRRLNKLVNEDPKKAQRFGITAEGVPFIQKAGFTRYNVTVIRESILCMRYQ